MSERRAFLVFLSVVILICAGLIYRERQQLEAERREFESNKMLWESSKPSNYEFSIRHSAAWAAPPPMRIAVRDGKVASATLLCLPPHTADWCKSWAEHWKERYGPDRIINHAQSISQLYELASKSMSDPNARVHLTFDSHYGYPTRFSNDNPETADDEYSFEIFDFKDTP